MRYLVCAGPTREPIDAVRYISNRSSGKLGFAIAAAAAAAGHEVTLLHGPVCLPAPEGLVQVVAIETAAELHREAVARFEHSDVAVMAAAVADFTPAHRESGKIRRTGDGLVLELEATRDVCAALGNRKRHDQVLVGFALEAEDPEHESARSKLVRKGCDLIVANTLATLDANEAALTLLDAEHVIGACEGSKLDLARWLVEQIDARQH